MPMWRATFQGIVCADQEANVEEDGHTDVAGWAANKTW